MIRLVEWSWCWFVCQEDFSIQNRFTVKRREIEKPTSWICVVKRGRGAYCTQLADDFPTKQCSEFFIDELDNREICCVGTNPKKRHLFIWALPRFSKVNKLTKLRAWVSEQGGGRVICTIPKRRGAFSRIPSLSVQKKNHLRMNVAPDQAMILGRLDFFWVLFIICCLIIFLSFCFFVFLSTSMLHFSKVSIRPVHKNRQNTWDQ